MMNTNTPFVKRHSLVLFFVLAYTISWIIFILAATLPNFPFLFPLGPLLAAFIVASLTGGLKDLLSRLLRWRACAHGSSGGILVRPLLALSRGLA